MKRIVFAGMALVAFHSAGQETTASPFGVEIADESWDLYVFPNPTSDFLTIRSSREIKHVEFYDINGKALPLPTMPNNCYSLQDVQPGWIFLLIESTDGFYDRRSVYKH